MVGGKIQEGRERKREEGRERKRERERDILSANQFPRWSQQPVTNQAKSRRKKPGSPTWVLNAQTLGSSSAVLPKPLTECRSKRTAGQETNIDPWEMLALQMVDLPTTLGCKPFINLFQLKKKL